MRICAIAALLFILFSSYIFGQNQAKITGYVRDADGNPLDLVNIRIKNTLIGTMSNEKGFYSLSVSTGDSVAVIYSCLGYNKAERIIPELTQDMRINVRMNFTSLELGEVVATAIRKQTTTLESLNAEQVKLLPDPTGGSIESLVVTFAGVSSNNELSSQYSVRGGSYDENIVYVNGLEVFRPLLIRSGQQEGLSFINPDMTESVNFSAGGFEARYGDKMSSVLDITYKKPKGIEGSVSASLLGASAYIGSGSGKFSQVTGVRYKTGRSLLNTTDTDAEYNPNFIDAQTFMTYQLTPKLDINFLGNLAINRFDFTPHSRETSFGTITDARKFTVYFNGQERDKFETLYGALTLNYQATEKMTLGLQASAFNSKEEETYDIRGEYWLDDAMGGSEDSDISKLSVANYQEHARNRLHATIMNVAHYGSIRLNNNTIKWGATVQTEKINDKISEWEKRDSAGYSLPQGGGSVNLIANLFSDNQLESTRISAYVQDMFKFRTPQGLFTLVGGVRGSYWSYNKEFIVSPRASLGFIPNFNQNLTFRIASGLYYQSPFYKELRTILQDEFGNDLIILNNKVKSQRSIHAIVGGDYVFRAGDRNFKLSADMYYKKLDNINPYTVDNVKIRYYGENCARGYAMGVDVKFFGEFVPGTDSWISFSLMKAQQTIYENITVPMPNSQGYNVSLFFQDYFPGYKRIKLSLKGVISGGLPVTPPRQGYLNNNWFRTPAYKRVDLGFSYQLAGGTDDIMDRGFFRHLKYIWFGIDIFNLFDIKNTSSYYWITNIDNHQYAIPNYLTGRQLNARVIVDF